MANDNLARELKKHTQQDADAFNLIHEHLNRLDEANKNELILYKLEELKKDVVEMRKEMKESARNFITRAEFIPVRNIVYGMVSIILTGVLLALVALITGKV
jgi:hypothetical protein